MTGVLLKGENWDIDTQKERISREDEGTDQGDASTSQGTLQIPCKQPEKEAWDRFSLTALRRNQLCQHLIWDFRLQNCETTSIFCGSLPVCAAVKTALGN